MSNEFAKVTVRARSMSMIKGGCVGDRLRIRLLRKRQKDQPLQLSEVIFKQNA